MRLRGGGCTLLEELGEGVAAGRVDRLELLDLVESVDVFVLKLDRHEVRVVVQSQTHRALHTTRSLARSWPASLVGHGERAARPELDADGAISGRAPPPRTPPGGERAPTASASDHLARSRAADLFDLALYGLFIFALVDI
jgi:hypothetical protein